jgi:hypothetical protein
VCPGRRSKLDPTRDNQRQETKRVSRLRACSFRLVANARFLLEISAECDVSLLWLYRALSHLAICMRICLPPRFAAFGTRQRGCLPSLCMPHSSCARNALRFQFPIFRPRCLRGLRRRTRATPQTGEWQWQVSARAAHCSMCRLENAKSVNLLATYAKYLTYSRLQFNLVGRNSVVYRTVKLQWSYLCFHNTKQFDIFFYSIIRHTLPSPSPVSE